MFGAEVYVVVALMLVILVTGRLSRTASAPQLFGCIMGAMLALLFCAQLPLRMSPPMCGNLALTLPTSGFAIVASVLLARYTFYLQHVRSD